MSVRFRITRMNVDFSRAERNVRVQSIRAVRLASELVLQKSKEYIPHDTGILENSGSTDFE